MSILISILVVGGSGLIIGLLLSIAGKKLAVETDEREVLIREALPGNNCGGCGFPGCDGAAAAILSGDAPVNVCPVGGAAAAAKIGEILGQEVSVGVRKTAFVKCMGNCDKAKPAYTYTGIMDCTIMPFVPAGGPGNCDHGCLGYGSCVRACQFDAISVQKGLAVVDRDLCKACGACVRVCPHHLIELVPYEGHDYHVQCSSNEKGKAVMNACDAGCISCSKCMKNCPSSAITLDNNIPVINYELCTNCGTCQEVCPRGCITSWK